MRVTLSTAPDTEPLALKDAKEHLRAGNDEDLQITALIVAARAHVEQVTGRALVTQTWAAKLDGFPASGGYRITLPRPKLQSVSSITYVDVNGTTQTLASGEYQVVPGGEYDSGYIVPAYGKSWPSTRDQPDTVTVTFIAGYGGPQDVPDPVVQYLKLLVGSMYLHREGEVTGAIVSSLGFADALIEPYRMRMF